MAVPLEYLSSLPPEAVGPRLLAAVEDQWFDRKSAATKPNKAIEAMVGMANADGGSLAFGLSEGHVQGIDRYESNVNALLQAGLDLAEPPIRTHAAFLNCIRDDGTADRILVLTIEPSAAPHATTGDVSYLRVGDENRRLSFVQRQELVFDKGQGQFEARLVAGATFSDLDREMVDAYVNACGGQDAVSVLRSRGAVGSAQTPTIGGLLLFGVEPQTELPEAYIRVLRYGGRERGAGSTQNLRDDNVFVGSIPKQLHAAREQIQTLQPTRRALRSGRFETVTLIPEDAWLEGLVNAAIHRSYSLGGDHIRVDIFDDRIEIESPGRFPGLVDVADPSMIARFARNPRIARVCSDLALGQEIGEGIRRIVREMADAGLAAPAYRQTAGSVRLTLSAEPAHRSLDHALGDDAAAVIRALRTATRLGTGELQDVLGVSRPVAVKRLRALEEAGLIARHGHSPKDPRAYWTVA